jgi:hypothetical protein
MPKTGAGSRLAAAAALVLILAAASWSAARQPLSFVVLGDTRGTVYLPAGRNAHHKTARLLEQLYGPGVEVAYHPETGRVERVTAPARGRKGPTAIWFRHGWMELMRRGRGEDSRVVARAEGRRWVFQRVAAALSPALHPGPHRPEFALHTGDMVYWAGQGKGLAQSPHWQRFQEELLAELPPPAGGLPGRLFPALGNHETWGDPRLAGVLQTMPYLARLGLSPQRRIYSFAVGGCRFIFLDSGGYKHGQVGWWSDHPGFQGQMAALSGWLRRAVEEKARQVFVVYHKPSFCLSGHGPLPPGHNPHPFLRAFSDRLQITVFNGHVHTTELYQVDGVRYLVLGGGGAPQVLQADPPPPGHPPELYWRGAPRQEEYNYLKVTVDDQGSRLLLHRFRPGQLRAPRERVELFAPGG